MESVLKKKQGRINQAKIIAFGFLLIIAVGTLLLTLPIANRAGVWTSPLTALFTATSASCVTGLVVVDTCMNWTVFGQIVILVMIQIGGLGFMTIGVFFSVFLRRRIGLRERGLLQESVNTLQIGGVVRLTKRIIKGTLLFEGIGALLLTIRFASKMNFFKALYFGVFHSISAFCNAGFDLMGYTGEYSSFVSFYDDVLINLTLIMLIVVGGIGFIVWDDIKRNGLHFKRYSLHTKIVLSATIILLSGGALLFFIFENNALFSEMSPGGKTLAALFSSATARTAGFNTVDTAALSTPSKLLTIVLMFIGGSPGSTAGGIKTTTIVVLLVYMLSTIRSSRGSNLFGRRIAEDTIRKAATVIMVNLFLAITAALIISAVQPLSFEDVIFEVVSAIGTVGMSTGVTRELTSISQIVIILLMYCGRIGSMTFALSFLERKSVPPVQLPVGKITVG